MAVGRGEIVTLLDDYEIPSAGMYIVRPPPADTMPNKIRVLTDIVERFGGDDWTAARGRPDAGGQPGTMLRAGP